MLNTRVTGAYDTMHIINVIHRLFLIQLYSTDTDLLNIVVNIDCLNGVFIQAKQYGSHDVAVIDGTSTITNSKEVYIESMLRNEVKSNIKLFKQCSH